MIKKTDNGVSLSCRSNFSNTVEEGANAGERGDRQAENQNEKRGEEDVVGFETVSGGVNMSVFVWILAGLDCLDLLTDLERGA